MRILLQDSHNAPSRPNGWSGAPGEADYVKGLNDRIVALAAARYPAMRITRVWGDAVERPEYAGEYEAFVTPHYESDTHGHASGCMWSRSATDQVAAQSDRLGTIIFRRHRALPGCPPERVDWITNNMRYYYAWKWLRAATPAAIWELGVGAPVCNGHGQPSAPDHDWLRAMRENIAVAFVEGLAEFGGLTAATIEPRWKVLGASNVTVAQMRSYLRSRNPEAPDVAPLYAQHAAAAGIRAEIAFAQACKETNFFRFTGTAKPEWHNPAGLGVTGAPDVGNRFGSWDEGIRAHAGHLLCYHGSHQPTFCDVDQRHFSPGQRLWTGTPRERTMDAQGHAGLPNDVRELNGRWAVPGTTYGETIADMAEELMRVPAARAPNESEILPAVYLTRVAYGYDPYTAEPIDPVGELPEYAKAPPGWVNPLE